MGGESICGQVSAVGSRNGDGKMMGERILQKLDLLILSRSRPEAEQFKL